MSMLRVAVPNKGALSEPATEILAEAGYRRRTDPKDLTVIDPANNVEFFFLRPKDIAIYVGSGNSTSGSPGATWSAIPTPRYGNVWLWASGRRASGTPVPPGGIGRRPTWPESGSPPPIRTSSEKTWPPRASRQP
ncbi:putative aTP phosphoribosyltransferase [Mycobacterium kansasii]|uniref:Putative aTP phosphoribosyltransferase n=1 Tax=Mycobacterium kansasii TaxID=1768 RepID=A0A1V3X4I1_MYCKA|nr:putative aTP phosphoribosyltransferase [Mycobacterium kansasii]